MQSPAVRCASHVPSANSRLLIAAALRFTANVSADQAAGTTAEPLRLILLRGRAAGRGGAPHRLVRACSCRARGRPAVIGAGRVTLGRGIAGGGAGASGSVAELAGLVGGQFRLAELDQGVQGVGDLPGQVHAR
jgi:hypothetical protein